MRSAEPGTCRHGYFGHCPVCHEQAGEGVAAIRKDAAPAQAGVTTSPSPALSTDDFENPTPYACACGRAYSHPDRAAACAEREHAEAADSTVTTSDPDDVDWRTEAGRLRLKILDADALAAAVDAAIYRGDIRADSLVADARLDYGEPFSRAQVAEILHGKRQVVLPPLAPALVSLLGEVFRLDKERATMARAKRNAIEQGRAWAERGRRAENDMKAIEGALGDRPDFGDPVIRVTHLGVSVEAAIRELEMAVAGNPDADLDLALDVLKANRRPRCSACAGVGLQEATVDDDGDVVGAVTCGRCCGLGAEPEEVSQCR